MMARPVLLALIPGLIVALITFDVHADSVGLELDGVCKVGTCPPTPLDAGGNLNQPFSFTTSLANGDTFKLSGLLTASNNAGNSISFGEGVGSGLRIEYLGNGQGGPSQRDTLTVTTLYAFAVNFASGSFFYGPVDGRFSPNISPDSSAQAIGLNNGSDVAIIPPFSPPGSFHADAVNYDAVNNGTVSLGDRTISIFGAGSPVGSYIFYGASAVPEPSSITIMCLGLALLGFAATRTHRPIGRS